jgi:hypothetical protein
MVRQEPAKLLHTGSNPVILFVVETKVADVAVCDTVC